MLLVNWKLSREMDLVLKAEMMAVELEREKEVMFWLLMMRESRVRDSRVST